jgi:hypothetical protein
MGRIVISDSRRRAFFSANNLLLTLAPRFHHARVHHMASGRVIRAHLL